MISTLASPSICVIDEDEKEFRPILAALNGLYLSCVHIRGDNIEQLPAQPFKGLRLVFTDLYLSSGAVGKDMASHTANVFQHIVSSETAPVIVIIWSKHANEQIPDPEVPLNDQETEAELFKRTLLEAEPKYKERLIFLEMMKPKAHDRPVDWIGSLSKQIEESLKGQPAVDALLTWEALVRDASLSVSEGMTSLAQKAGEEVSRNLEENLQASMRLLARAQSEGDLSPTTAPRHLSTVLAQLLMDQMEHSDGIEKLLTHGKWLIEQNPSEEIKNAFVPRLNGLLLTSSIADDIRQFGPGTVYKSTSVRNFRKTFGKNLSDLIDSCCNYKRPNQKWKEWRKCVKPVFIEISPACDVALNHRCSALLVAGVIVPSSMNKYVKNGEAWISLPIFSLRWPKDDFKEQDALLVFCSRYKVTMPATIVPEWLKPWFRMRELPTASLRNWHAGHASRVGYVYL